MTIIDRPYIATLDKAYKGYLQKFVQWDVGNKGYLEPEEFGNYL